MFQNKEVNQEAKSVVKKAISGLSTMGAVIATFFVTPLVFSATEGWVESFAYNHYGSAVSELAAIPWFVIVALTTYFTARMTVGALMLMGLMSLMVRLL